MTDSLLKPHRVGNEQSPQRQTASDIRGRMLAQQNQQYYTTNGSLHLFRVPKVTDENI